MLDLLILVRFTAYGSDQDAAVVSTIPAGDQWLSGLQHVPWSAVLACFCRPSCLLSVRPWPDAGVPCKGIQVQRLWLGIKTDSCACCVQVMDSLVVSLCKWTSLLDPSAPKPAVAFGEMPKARMAMEVVFQVGNRYAAFPVVMSIEPLHEWALITTHSCCIGHCWLQCLHAAVHVSACCCSLQ